MSEVKAQFIDNESKLNLKPGDLFDKIINLKFVCREVATGKQEIFVIRSDYELVYPNTDFDTQRNASEFNGKFIIRRCTHKPSIKVQCKMVTSNTGTSIGITVSNFFMLSSDGKHLRSFNAEDYLIDYVEIVMGYWGQLKDSIDFNKDSEALLKSYFNPKAINGADRIAITSGGESIIVTTEKLPPDSAIHIKGYVANIYSSPVEVPEVDKAKDTVVQALKKPVIKSGTKFEEVLFENITRRYLNGHRIVDVDKEFETEKGQLSEEDAQNYGVRVFLSRGASKVGIKSIKSSSGEEAERKVYFEDGWTIGHTLTRIFSYINADLDYTYTLEGDVIVYTPKEMQNPQTIYEDCEEQDMYKDTVLENKQLYDNRIPAVYNINIDAVATIVCPFFTFLEPFQYIEFASRYALNGIASFYANYSPTVQRFLVISASVSFATVEEVNDVQITAVSYKENYQKEKS